MMRLSQNEKIKQITKSFKVIKSQNLKNPLRSLMDGGGLIFGLMGG